MLCLGGGSKGSLQGVCWFVFQSLPAHVSPGWPLWTVASQRPLGLADLPPLAPSFSLGSASWSTSGLVMEPGWGPGSCPEACVRERRRGSRPLETARCPAQGSPSASPSCRGQSLDFTLGCSQRAKSWLSHGGT